MEIPSIRTGNDFTIVWAVTDNYGNPYRLDGKSLKLFMKNARSTIDVENFSVDGNVLKWEFPGTEQISTGTYSLTAVITETNGRMLTIDKCSAFRLVPESCLESSGSEGIFEGGNLCLGSQIAVIPILAGVTPSIVGNTLVFNKFE